MGRPLLKRWWRVFLALGCVLAALVGFGLYWFQPWKLWTDHRVDEALPGVVVTSGSPSTTAAGTPEPLSTSAQSSATSVDTPTPAAPVVLTQADFVSKEHGTSGRSSIVQLADGRRIVRFDDLDTSNGPDLRVILSPAPHTAGWSDFGAGSHELAALKGNQGSQNYEIGADIDLSKYRSVVIWCARFSVAFGAAAL